MSLNKTNFFDSLDKCYIIAEIGVNHNGDMVLANELIAAAKEAGADAVKFQTFRAESLVTKGTPKVAYQKSTTDPSETHYDMIKNLELSRKDHFPLMEYSGTLGIDFLSTPYDIESAIFLQEELNVKMFKVASADIVDLPLLDFIASTGKPTILSGGMATLGEIEISIDCFAKRRNNNIVLLHCVSNYPCTPQSLNLNTLSTLKNAFNIPVGFSDHSLGNEATIISIAKGAIVIEKHFTLDKSFSGPDHEASSTPKEFKSLVKAIRLSEIILGDSRKVCQEEEKQMSQVSRKSITLIKNLKKGQTISKNQLIMRRPGTGIFGNKIDYFVGKKLNKNLDAGALLRFSDVD